MDAYLIKNDYYIKPEDILKAFESDNIKYEYRNSVFDKKPVTINGIRYYRVVDFLYNFLGKTLPIDKVKDISLFKAIGRSEKHIDCVRIFTGQLNREMIEFIYGMHCPFAIGAEKSKVVVMFERLLRLGNVIQIEDGTV